MSDLRSSLLMFVVILATLNANLALAQQNDSSVQGAIEIKPTTQFGPTGGPTPGGPPNPYVPTYPQGRVYSDAQVQPSFHYLPNQNVAYLPPVPNLNEIGRGLQYPLSEHHLRLRSGPAWHMITPMGVDDQSPTKLNLMIDYGYKLFNRSSMSISFLVPLALQVNTKSFYENSLISFMAGVQFEMRFVRDIWFYGYLAMGLGTGFVHVSPDSRATLDSSSTATGTDSMARASDAGLKSDGGFSMSQTGLATHMGIGIKVKWTKFDLSIEPLSIPIFSAFGPGARGTIASWVIPIGVTVHF